MKCSTDWCEGPDGHDYDCSTATELAVLRREREEAKVALARGVREERAAIVDFLRQRLGFTVAAERIERAEHAEEALRLASTRVDDPAVGTKVFVQGEVKSVIPAWDWSEVETEERVLVEFPESVVNGRPVVGYFLRKNVR